MDLIWIWQNPILHLALAINFLYEVVASLPTPTLNVKMLMCFLSGWVCCHKVFLHFLLTASWSRIELYMNEDYQAACPYRPQFHFVQYNKCQWSLFTPLQKWVKTLAGSHGCHKVFLHYSLTTNQSLVKLSILQEMSTKQINQQFYMSYYPQFGKFSKDKVQYERLLCSRCALSSV